MDRVILVDETGREIGTSEKVKAHADGLLHRAFSIFILNSRDELLVQRRAVDKYHSGGLWSNACCSHPRPGEAIEAAARRRLREEMGFECKLEPAFSFVYRERVSAALWEHELDDVLIGRWDGVPDPDPAEVADWRWIAPDDLRSELRRQPSAFTVWFPLAFSGLVERGLIPEPERI